MASIKLRREAFQNAMRRVRLNDEERSQVEKLVGDGARTVNVTIRVDALPTTMMAGLLDEPSLNANQRAMLSMRVHGVRGNRDDYRRIYQTTVSSAIEFASTFAALGIESPNCELFLGGRWYPITMGAETHEDESKIRRWVQLQASLAIGDVREQLSMTLGDHLFREIGGDAVEMTVASVLVELGLRPLETTASEFNLKLLEAERSGRDRGRQVWIVGPGLVSNRYSWWGRLESRSIGSPHSPRRAIIDDELETQVEDRHYYGVNNAQTASRLPFVRVFSFDTKKYVYVDVEDLREYEFDDSAIGRLHLPDHMLSILTTVFSAPTEQIFGDLIAGKHGGIVVLASGNPGVGKTLTAEVYSEMTRRPLYVLELGELGTTAEQVEENLNRVFTRVVRWDAVLQFDECEIFLARRGQDLERSAIVGIFLRLLDYYRGILFLTTNRVDVIDEAVLSRVTLRLAYPDLDEPTRRGIWTTMAETAELQFDGDLEPLTRLPLNGRQIRNVVRLTKLVHKSGAVAIDQVVELAKASTGVTGPPPENGITGPPPENGESKTDAPETDPPETNGPASRRAD